MRERISTGAPAPQAQTQAPARQATSNGAALRAIGVGAAPAKTMVAILRITKEIGSIAKSGRNTFHNYDYQKWEDILNKLAPLLPENNLIVVQSAISTVIRDDGLMVVDYGFDIYNEDGEAMPQTIIKQGSARWRDSKGVIDDKASVKCETQAQKYFYINLFKIKTQDAAIDDADAGDDTSRQQNGNGGRRGGPPPADQKPKPHKIVGVNGETAESWSKKFIAMVSKADSTADIDEWDKLNSATIDMLKDTTKGGSAALYNSVVEAMQKRAAEIAPKGDAAPSIQNPDEFLEFISGRLIAANSNEELDTIWDTYCDKHTDENAAKVDKFDTQTLDRVQELFEATREALNNG